jgi:uncharacterized protein (DUF488 family)
MSTLFTAGHSTRPIEELTAMLGERQIERLTDVRRFPASRRHPQFSREALATSLAAVGVSYHHEPDLGGRRQPRRDSPHSAWRVAAFRGYADWMDEPPFRAAFDRLLEEAQASRVVILCAEAVPWRCHRRLISDAATVRGFAVEHLLAPGRTSQHELDGNARLVTQGEGVASGWRLIYDGGALPLQS